MTQLPDNTTNNLPELAEPSKQDRFISALFAYPTIQEAAHAAGYSNKSVTSHVYTLLKNPAFITKMREHAIANNLIALPTIARIEKKCLEIVEREPENYPKYKEIFRQTKQISGLLAQDTQPVQPTINIKSIEHLQVVLGDQVHKRTLTLDKPVKAQDMVDADILSASDRAQEGK